jgi:hypothetical protein
MRDSRVEISGQVQTIPTQNYEKKNIKGMMWGVAQLWRTDPVTTKSIFTLSKEHSTDQYHHTKEICCLGHLSQERHVQASNRYGT